MIKEIMMDFDDPRFEPVDGSKPKRKGKGAKFTADSKGNVKKNFKGGGLAEAIEKVKAKEMEKGGEVPSKFKGFSKLPEEVQKKMDPALAERFEDGGPVKMGSGGGVCKGMGIARAGGKFKVR